MELRGACNITYEGLLSYGIVSSIIYITKNWGGVVAKWELSVYVWMYFYKKEKGRPFILWGQPQPLLCNLCLLMVEVNSKIAILPRYLTFCLGIYLDLLPRLSCFVKDVITKIQDIMAPSPKRHGSKSKTSWPKSTGVDQPINWPYLLQKKKSPKSKGTGGFIRY
jgi:hypothetical protein